MDRHPHGRHRDQAGYHEPSLVFLAGTETRLVAKGRVRAARDGTAVVEPFSTFQCGTGEFTLAVRLEGSGESIDHRSACTSDPDQRRPG